MRKPGANAGTVKDAKDLCMATAIDSLNRSTVCEAYTNLGNALKEQGKLAEAASAYEQALKLLHDFS